METGQSLNSVTVVDPANLADPGFLLALALLTLGIPRDANANGGEVIEFREEKTPGNVERRFVFVFDPKGVDGIDTATWIARWNDPAWLAANIQSPLRWMKELGSNLRSFAHWMGQHDPVFVFRRSTGGGAHGLSERIAYVPASLLETPRGHEIFQRAGIAR